MQLSPFQTNHTAGGSLIRRTLPLLIAALLVPFCLDPMAQADTLDKIRSSGTLSFGFRDDARPFSYKDDAGQPAGFSVELCRKVADQLKTELALPGLTVQWTPVTVAERHPAVEQGRVDLHCGADSITLTEREHVSFSLPIFPSGVGALMRPDAPAALRDILEGKPATGAYWRASPARILNQRTFAVVPGTTAETWLKERIQNFQLDVNIVPVASYADGIAALTASTADVLFGDRAILVEAAGNRLTDGSVLALDRQFTNAPLALTLARNNDALRLIVDRVLSDVYGSPDFKELYMKSFGIPQPETLRFYETVKLSK